MQNKNYIIINIEKPHKHQTSFQNQVENRSTTKGMADLSSLRESLKKKWRREQRRTAGGIRGGSKTAGCHCHITPLWLTGHVVVEQGRPKRYFREFIDTPGNTPLTGNEIPQKTTGIEFRTIVLQISMTF
jgi:hypothetical protein